MLMLPHFSELEPVPLPAGVPMAAMPVLLEVTLPPVVLLLLLGFCSTTLPLVKVKSCARTKPRVPL